MVLPCGWAAPSPSSESFQTHFHHSLTGQAVQMKQPGGPSHVCSEEPGIKLVIGEEKCLQNSIMSNS